jgi:hypothetical protein
MQAKPLQFNKLNINELSDEELSRAFTRRDGRWSKSTQRMLRKFKTTKLDLNENWANQSQGWVCPACGRSKDEIVRITDRGVLLARLELHHDHLHDYLSRRLCDEFGGKWPSKIPAGTYDLEHLGSIMIERFEKIVICADCNTADAVMKQRSPDIHKNFSFRPDEIIQFVNARPNRSHEFYDKKAIRIWESEKADFDLRLAFADQLFGFIQAGRLKRIRNRYPEGDTFGEFFRTELHNSTARDLIGLYQALGEIRKAFKERSISTPVPD